VPVFAGEEFQELLKHFRQTDQSLYRRRVTCSLIDHIFPHGIWLRRVEEARRKLQSQKKWERAKIGTDIVKAVLFK